MEGKARPSMKSALICVGTHPLDPRSIQLTASILQTLELQPVLLHVIRSRGEEDRSQQILDAAYNLLGIPSAERLHRIGTVPGEIHAELKSREYSLLVLGTGGYSPGEPSTSLSQRLANGVSLSVLLVRPPAGKIRRMLICTSGGPASKHLVQWGIRLAKESSAMATILHVASAAPEMYAGLPLLTEDLAHVLSRDTPLSKHLREIAIMAEQAGVEAELELRHGMVAEEITRACEMENFDFIVLGAPKTPASMNSILLDKVTPMVLPSISCSILVVRTDAA